MRLVPQIWTPARDFLVQLAALINKAFVFQTSPTLRQMEVGEVAIGNDTESGSDAIYFKPDRNNLYLIIVDGDGAVTGRAIGENDFASAFAADFSGTYS